MKINYLILFLSLSFLQNSYAGPTVSLCIDGDCKSSIKVSISDEDFSNISEVFITPSESSSQSERELIARAIALIEKISLGMLSTKTIDDISAQKLHNNMNDKDKTINYKTFIGLLLDHRLIQQHILRKSEKRTSWTGKTEYSIVIQDLKNGKLYAVDASNTDFATAPEITLFENWKNKKSLRGLTTKATNIISKPDKTQFKNNANQ